MSPSFPRHRAAFTCLLVSALGLISLLASDQSVPEQPAAAPTTPTTSAPSPLLAPAAPASTGEAATAAVAPPPPAPLASPAGGAANPPLNSSYGQAVTRLPAFTVEGRQDELIGVADSATQGTVGSDELADRPLLRTGEILERFPGS